MQSIKGVDKVRTSIGLRMATKYLILDHSMPGESLEDTIVRLIHSYDRLKQENEELLELIERNGITQKNLLSIDKVERILDSIEINLDLVIHYSYNMPPKEIKKLDDYQMDIQLEKVFTNGKNYSFKELDLSEEEMIDIHFRIVEKIINEHFDKAYKIPDNLNLFDYRYWKRVFFRVGLPESSYLSDVISTITVVKSG